MHGMDMNEEYEDGEEYEDDVIYIYKYIYMYININKNSKIIIIRNSIKIHTIIMINYNNHHRCKWMDYRIVNIIQEELRKIRWMRALDHRDRVIILLLVTRIK